MLDPAEKSEFLQLAEWLWRNPPAGLSPEDQAAVARLARLALLVFGPRSGEATYTVGQVARMTGLMNGTIRDRIHAGTLDAVKQGRRWRIPRSEALRLRREIRVQGPWPA